MNAGRLTKFFEVFAIFVVSIVSIHSLDCGHIMLDIFIFVFSNLSLSRGGGDEKSGCFLFSVEGVVAE